MEQEVLLVEDVIDAEIEREVRGRVVMDLHVDDEEIVERAIDVGDDVGVVECRILLAAVARCDGVGPALVRPVGHADLGAPIRHIGNALADHGGRQVGQRIDARPACVCEDLGIDIGDAAEQLQAGHEHIVLFGPQFDALHPDCVHI
ncbi:hypothetical protein NS44R_14725, partial [Mammaliicoccus sciuri]